VAQLARALEKVKTKDAGTEMLEDALASVEEAPEDDLTMAQPDEMPPQEPMSETPAPPQEEPKGLMSRRTA